MKTPSSDRFPVLIVAGFLGAGKTTFIRELLPRLMGGPRAPYVILNDFLNASIDAHTLEGLGGEIKAMPAGCVCCDDSEGLVEAILRVPTSIRPVLIIEANGTTDPYRLIEILTLSASLRDRLGPIHQVTLINEARWGKRWFPGDKHTEKAQVRTASAILTNRAELATDRQRQRLQNDLRELNSLAPHLDTEAIIELLLQDDMEERLPSPDTTAPISHLHRHVAVQLEPPVMSEERLRQWLLGLPREILRVKGLVRLSDTEMAYFNRTDDPFESPRIIKTRAQQGMEPAAVFIGPGLSEKFLRSSFRIEDQRREFKLSL